MGRRSNAQIATDNARLEAEVDYLLGRTNVDPRNEEESE